MKRGCRKIGESGVLLNENYGESEETRTRRGEL